MDDGGPTTLALLQPTRRRVWELHHGDEKVAELRLPAARRGGRAQAGGRELEIQVHGLFKQEHVLVDASGGEEVARVRGRTVDLRGVERAEWRSLGRGAGYGLVGPDGEPWLRAKAKSGTFPRRARSRLRPGTTWRSRRCSRRTC